MARPTNALIVEDEAHVRVFLRLLLKEVGIEQVWEATDGAQALALVGAHRPELILLDISMPVMSGLEVLEHVAEEYPEVPVIMVSSQSAMKTVFETAKRGAVAYILKHSPKAEALKILSDTLDQLEHEADEENS